MSCNSSENYTLLGKIDRQGGVPQGVRDGNRTCRKERRAVSLFSILPVVVRGGLVRNGLFQFHEKYFSRYQ